ncbi:MAG: hypothetical protein IPO06_20925 [Leptospiraceae bacterium]|nr:hypothetical protein [Leptospiraceae bacterium]
MKKIFLMFICSVFLLPMFLLADRIVLKNGKTITGTVQGQENNLVTIITASGERQQIKKEDIVSMIYVETKAVKKKPVPRKNPTKIVAKDTKANTLDKPTKSSDKTHVNNNEKNIDRLERTTVDKEVTDKVMQKFEDADKRRLQSTSSEIQVLKEELDYLKKERERMQRANEGDDDYKRILDKRMAGIEIQIRHLERFLAMDETQVDYFKRKRTPWDLVWRSALFPGWGHRYAREEYTGNTYSTTVPLLIGFGFLFSYIAKTAENSASDALYNGVVVKSIQYSSLGVSSTYSNTLVLSSYANYNTSMSAIDAQKELSQNLLHAAVGLYLIQIVHAYFTGVEWSKVQPRDYSNEGLQKPLGLNFKSKVDTNNYAKVPERGIRYEVEFSTNF